jgi:hypothetical protein
MVYRVGGSYSLYSILPEKAPDPLGIKPLLETCHSIRTPQTLQLLIFGTLGGKNRFAFCKIRRKTPGDLHHRAT